MKAFRFIVGLLLVAPGLARAAEPFALKDGDRVVFYGDSITDQRLYTTFAETFVVTRFPKMNVTFVHSGWGGDRVTGGGGGPVDVRLERDVIAYKPTVMTIMLGMNDASYRAFDEGIFNTYAKGYEHIVEKVKSADPGVRLTLIVPSPFDDVTRPPNFEGGYNAVLLRYGEFVKKLAAKEGAHVADLNTSVVDATKRAFQIDPAKAVQLNGDRVHPGPGGQLLMAEALLKSWNAPATVSAVSITLDGDKPSAQAKKSKVEKLTADAGAISWTQLDEALPFPINYADPVTALAVKASDVVQSLDEQTLKVQGLKAENYALQIDGADVGAFTKAQLEGGVNLATLPTPMFRQAAEVHQLTLEHNNVHFLRWRQVQVAYEKARAAKKVLAGLDEIEAELVARQRAAAQPKPHQFVLQPK